MDRTAKSHNPSIRIVSISAESPAANGDQRVQDADRVRVQIDDGSMTRALDFLQRAPGRRNTDTIDGCDLDDIRAVARRCYLAGVRDAGGNVDAAARALEQASRAALAEMEAAVREAGGALLSVELEGDVA